MCAPLNFYQKSQNHKNGKDKDASHKNVAKAGEFLMLKLYGAKKSIITGRLSTCHVLAWMEFISWSFVTDLN